MKKSFLVICILLFSSKLFALELSYQGYEIYPVSFEVSKNHVHDSYYQPWIIYKSTHQDNDIYDQFNIIEAPAYQKNGKNFYTLKQDKDFIKKWFVRIDNSKNNQFIYSIYYNGDQKMISRSSIELAESERSLGSLIGMVDIVNKIDVETCMNQFKTQPTLNECQISLSDGVNDITYNFKIVKKNVAIKLDPNNFLDFATSD